MVRLCHKRIPELLVRNGLFFPAVARRSLTRGCHVVQAELPSANCPTGDGEKGGEGHSQHSSSHAEKKQAHEMITVGQLNQSILVAQQRILLYLLSDCSREIRLWWVLSLCLMLRCIYLLIKYSKRKTDSPLFSSTYFFHINGYLIN